VSEVKLYCGDCLEILPTLDLQVDAIITDLPYGTTACKWDSVIPFEPMWAQVRRLLKKRGAFVTTASQPFTSALITSNLEWFRYEWIWEKERPTNIFSMKRRPGAVHENILVFYAKQPTYSPIMKPRSGSRVSPNYDLRKCENNGTESYGMRQYRYSGEYDSTKKYPRSVLYFVRDRDVIHPTQKPVALYEYLVRTYTNEGDTVLDFVMGSGTTGVACVNTNRNFIGIELDAGYYETAKQRIEEAQQQIRMEL
jgi:DNA modification methylase